MKKQDKIVISVIEKFAQRSDVGIEKYGKTLYESDLTTLEWLTHIQEELMDATLYVERLKQQASTRTMCLTTESFTNADKRTIDGFVYVKFSDLDILPI